MTQCMQDIGNKSSHIPKHSSCFCTDVYLWITGVYRRFITRNRSLAFISRHVNVTNRTWPFRSTSLRPASTFSAYSPLNCSLLSIFVCQDVIMTRTKRSLKFIQKREIDQRHWRTDDKLYYPLHIKSKTNGIIARKHRLEFWTSCSDVQMKCWLVLQNEGNRHSDLYLAQFSCPLWCHIFS